MENKNNNKRASSEQEDFNLRATKVKRNLFYEESENEQEQEEFNIESFLKDVNTTEPQKFMQYTPISKLPLGIEFRIIKIKQEESSSFGKKRSVIVETADFYTYLPKFYIEKYTDKVISLLNEKIQSKKIIYKFMVLSKEEKIIKLKFSCNDCY